LAKELLNAGGGSTSVSKDNGYVTNKAAALQASITRNADEQDRVSTRAAAVEKRLRAQYSALDAKMATMSSLSSYVTAQLAQWNKSTG
jgi:flagellar hook-associated protein 2